MNKHRRLMLHSAAALAGACLLARRGAAAAAVSASLGPDERALHALNRLGYGPRPADAAAIAEQGAEKWLDRFLTEQLEPRRLPPPAALAERLAGLDVLKLGQAELLGRYREAVKATREAKREQAKGETPSADALNAVREKVRPLVQQAATARLARGLQSPAQLEEVLTEFWFNHLNVFVGKGPVRPFVGHYEINVIRANALGRFEDLLLASARHPAMLFYLDQAQSNSRGLNENYARELMELHTLGVNSGYTQKDVRELAIELLGEFEDVRAVATLQTLVADSDPDIRETAAQLLAERQR